MWSFVKVDRFGRSDDGSILKAHNCCVWGAISYQRRPTGQSVDLFILQKNYKMVRS